MMYVEMPILDCYANKFPHEDK